MHNVINHNAATWTICFTPEWSQSADAIQVEGYEASDNEPPMPQVLLESESRHSNVQEHKVLHQEVQQIKQLQNKKDTDRLGIKLGMLNLNIIRMINPHEFPEPKTLSMKEIFIS